MTFGEVVLHYLNTLGVSQSELARRASRPPRDAMTCGNSGRVDWIRTSDPLTPSQVADGVSSSDEKSPPTRRPRGVPRGTGGEGAAIIG